MNGEVENGVREILRRIFILKAWLYYVNNKKPIPDASIRVQEALRKVCLLISKPNVVSNVVHTTFVGPTEAFIS